MNALMYQMYVMHLFQGSRYIKKVFLLSVPILAKKRFIGFIGAYFGRLLTNIYQLIHIYSLFGCIKCIWMNLIAHLGTKTTLVFFSCYGDEPLNSAIYIQVHLIH